MAQLKSHNFRKSRKSKAKATLFAAVSEEIFTRIMNQKSTFDIWNFLKTEYAGDEKLKGLQKLNLIREFEMQQMKESDTIKEYTDKLHSIANKIRLLGSEFSDSKIVQKILVTVPERFDATISSMESSKDLSTITLAKLNSALQAQEQRRLMRIEGSVEGALQAKLQINHGEKDKKKSSKKNSHSGCTNHMTGDEELFRELDRSQVSNVRIGNGDCTPVKGKGTVAIESCTGTKLIFDVLYVPDIDQNLLSVGQLVVKGFKVIFENKLGIIIKDTYDNDVIRIKMRGKSFLLDPMEEEQAAYTATTTNIETWHKRLGHEHVSEDIVVDDEVVVKEKVGLKKDEKLKEDGKNNEDKENATFHDMGSTKDKGKEMHINLPFVNSLSLVLKYAKYLKDLITNKMKLEGVSMVVLNEGLTMMICKEMSKRLKDPGSFTI
nr:uncharacterized protein LOC109838978 [Ipomoea trifida]